MKTAWGSLLVLLVLSAAPAFATWQINTVWSESDSAMDLTLGSGRNDGITRLYAANNNTYMYEYTWNGSGWTRVQFGHTLGTEWAYLGVTVGQPTNWAGQILFTGNENNSACSFRYNGASFVETNLTRSDVCQKTDIGPGRNTSTIYGYVACEDNNLYEYYYNGSAWNAPTTVGSTGTLGAHAVAVGLGRSTDSNYYVYGGGADGRLYEFRYNGAPYVRTQIVNTGAQINDIVIEAGRNGSATRYVYCGNNNGQIWESGYSGSWVSSSITASSIGAVFALALGDGRNDGTVRLYAATANNAVYEMTWNGVCWGTPVNCGSPSANDIYSLALGTGRDTSTPYLYAGSGDGTVYEYEWIPPTATPTATTTFTHTATASPTASRTATFTPTRTASQTASQTATATPTATASLTASATRTITLTASRTPTFSATPTITATSTISPTASISPTPTLAPVPSLRVEAYPIPAKEQVSFTVEMAEAGEATVSIYNLNAELIAQVKEDLPAGRGVLVWNCRSAASGVYLARVQAPGMELKTIRIAVTH
ncbi:MAG: hypothetical protein AB1439_04970 [candidate division FCPU426 bacterium]